MQRRHKLSVEASVFGDQAKGPPGTSQTEHYLCKFLNDASRLGSLFRKRMSIQSNELVRSHTERGTCAFLFSDWVHAELLDEHTRLVESALSRRNRPESQLPGEVIEHRFEH